MKATLEKLKVILRELEEERGLILFFGFFRREGAFGKWDLLVSASWLNPVTLEAHEIIVQMMRKHLTVEERLNVSRVVLLGVDEPATAFLQELYSVAEDPILEVQNCMPLTDEFGFTIERAFVLRCIYPIQHAQNFHE